MIQRLAWGVSACALALAAAARGEEAASDAHTVSGVTIIGTPGAAELDQPPQTTQSITGHQALATINATTVEDELKYLPDVFVRERHIGDTQEPLATRTSGVGSSARSLIYEDGILVSSLIGNNNTNASPRWGLVFPEEVDRIDILYGPFSAAFPGNSLGEVVQITTRMPERLEGEVSVQGAVQTFHQYGTDSGLPTGRFSGIVGDKLGRLSFWLGASVLDTKSQPLYDITSTTPATVSAAGEVVTGAYPAFNRSAQAVQILGAGGIERQIETTVSFKAAYELTPKITATYGLGFFANHDDAAVQSYLSAGGAQVYAGTLNIGGRAYSVPASAFDSDLYRFGEDHLAQSLSLGSHTGGVVDWELSASDYLYLKDEQRNPTTALPGAFTGGPGTITSLDNSGWRTLDAKGWWRPQGPTGLNQFSFGLHEDLFRLDSPKSNTADWFDGPPASTAAVSQGKTETEAVWLQDMLTLAPAVTLTLGGRYEWWRAYDGFNASLAPHLSVVQPHLSDQAFSPKAVLAWTPADWRFSASIARAVRFPTVEELYQSVTTGNLVSVPNPNLSPEDAVSTELSAEHDWRADAGRFAKLRVSLFDEHVANALISQSAPLVPGSSTLYSYVQNVGRTRVEGVELVAEEHDFGVRGLTLSGWVTYAKSVVQEDAAYPAAVGRQLPQLPPLRAALVETYRPTSRLTVTVAERYSDKSFGAINNSDSFENTFTGFSAYFVADVHVQYAITPHLIGDFGVNNINDRRYFEYHPFPQRTFFSGIRYKF